MESQNETSEDNSDLPWSEKLSRLYWTGSSTGGWATSSNWKQLHRMRLTVMTSQDNMEPVHLLEGDASSFWQSIQQGWSGISNLFHLRITNIVQCEDSECEEMKVRFGPLHCEPQEEALNSKYVLDVDGNTFSGRYYRLLKSNSCVLKHTAFDEWHDGRIVPWVHFVSVSAGAEELGEVIRYLRQDDEGMAFGEKIAQQGKNWTRATLRSDDLEIAFVRILLEYARLLRDDRDDWHV